MLSPTLPSLPVISNVTWVSPDTLYVGFDISVLSLRSTTVYFERTVQPCLPWAISAQVELILLKDSNFTASIQILLSPRRPMITSQYRCLFISQIPFDYSSILVFLSNACGEHAIH